MIRVLAWVRYFDARCRGGRGSFRRAPRWRIDLDG